MYNSYADNTDYSKCGNGTIPEDEVDKRLCDASNIIDGFTFNRIKQIGTDKLTEFQIGLIKEANVNIADFYYENEDMLTSVLGSYSIYGIGLTIQEGSINIFVQDGMAISSYDYNLLKQTGLACLSFMY